MRIAVTDWRHRIVQTEWGASGNPTEGGRQLPQTAEEIVFHRGRWIPDQRSTSIVHAPGRNRRVDVGLPRIRDDVRNTLREYGGTLYAVLLGGPAGARKDVTPGIEGPGADFAHAGDPAGRIEHIGGQEIAPGGRVGKRVEVRHEWLYAA